MRSHLRVTQQSFFANHAVIHFKNEYVVALVVRGMCTICKVRICVIVGFLLLSRTIEFQVVGRGIGESQDVGHKNPVKLYIMNVNSAWHAQSNYTLSPQPSPAQVGWKWRRVEKEAQVK